MNVALWVLQVLAALLYAASGVMKVFLFDDVSGDVPSFGALPRAVWKGLGVLELCCTVLLIAPGLLRWRPVLTTAAAFALAAESLVFIWVHVRYEETGSTLFSAALGATMLFIAFGRWRLAPLR